MDLFIAFLAFVVLIALEFLLSQYWMGAYFRFGIPLYHRRGRIYSSANAETLSQALIHQFSGRTEHPSIRFKALAPGQVAFRETLFENRGGFRYLPVMHSLLRLHPEQGGYSLTGYLNWYVLYILVYLILHSIEDRTFVPIAVLVLFLLALSYAAQFGIHQQVAEKIEE